jgi:hypothetical protein
MDAAIPLVGLDAVVIDTETTGLDTNSARIVQMAAVRIVKGRIADEAPFVTLVDPGEPIPAAATAVYGVADTDVAGAPGFVAAYAALRDYVGTDLIVARRSPSTTHHGLCRPSGATRSCWSLRRRRPARSLWLEGETDDSCCCECGRRGVGIRADRTGTQLGKL